MRATLIYDTEPSEVYSMHHIKYVVNYYHLHLENSCIKNANGQLLVTNKTDYYKELFRNPMEMDDETL